MNVGYALLLSTLAGLSTTIGSFLVLFIRKPGPKFMTLTLGFSAGVMILVSFVELLQTGIKTAGFGPANIAFFAGMAIMFLLDVSIPHDYMAEHHRDIGAQGRKLARTGLFVAIGIAIHNFPEGIAVFFGTVHDPKLGVAIAVALALHNIPEGIAVSVPVYAATGSRTKSVLWSFLSGFAEPAGALIAAVFLLPFLTQHAMGYVLSAVAGIMVFIALDELAPVSKSYGEEHLSIVGLFIGMVVMSVSLWLLGCC